MNVYMSGVVSIALTHGTILTGTTLERERVSTFLGERLLLSLLLTHVRFPAASYHIS